MRLIVLIDLWLSLATVAVCLLRLCYGEWPVVLKYQQWEYVLKVVGGAVMACWCYWAVYLAR